VLVYPNPSDGKIFLRLNRSCSSTDVFVEDQSGRRVFNQLLLSADMTTPLEIDLTRLSEGVYFVHVKCDDYHEVWKIAIL
jgi:hypothetical protein